jgi:tetratricopeptide (TPR) repeat protein
MNAANENRSSFLSRNLVIREPLLILLLALCAIVFFVFTHTYSQAYDNRREQLGRHWLDRAQRDLADNRAAAAIEDFRTALAYIPQSWECRMGLAKSLMRARAYRQAQQYFAGLWQLRPQNGLVNLELARLAARENNSEEAERYYNGAIFGDWTDNPEDHRHEAAFELIDFYLQRHDLRRAESQLITVSGNLPDDPALQIRVADLFMRVQDYQRALDFYKRAARQQSDNLAALLGAGKAALQLGDYRMAENYFSRAVLQDDSDVEAKKQRELAQTVLQLDPLERGINSREKARRVLQSYQIIGERLNACGPKVTATPGPATAPISTSLIKWNQWKPNANLLVLVRNPDQADELFDFVLQAEQSTQAICGLPSLEDDALLALVRKRSSEEK